MEHKTLTVLVVVLAICLTISLGFNGYTYLKLTSDQPPYHITFFSFVFGPTMQNITQGNLYLNMTFDIEEGNLTVKAEVNTDSYNPNAFLALQFDSDNNGTIDIPYRSEEDFYYYTFGENDLQFLLRVDNQTTVSLSEYWGWLPGDRVYFSRILPRTYPYRIESPFHYCLYNRFVYTVIFSFPRSPKFLNGSWVSGEYGIQGDLVRALYGIESPLSSESPEKGMTVYVPPFNFMG